MLENVTSCVQKRLLDVTQLHSVHVHGEDGGEEKGLEEEVGEERHHGEKTKLLNGTIENTDEESQSEDCDFSKEILGDVPAFSAESLGHSNLHVEMRLGSDDAPCDHHEVLQTDEGDEVGHHAHLATHVERQSGESQGHEDGTEDGGNRAEGDADLGVNQVDLLAGVVDVQEEAR